MVTKTILMTLFRVIMWLQVRNLLQQLLRNPWTMPRDVTLFVLTFYDREKTATTQHPELLLTKSQFQRPRTTPTTPNTSNIDTVDSPFLFQGEIDFEMFVHNVGASALCRHVSSGSI
jgi:hypothetical protein